MQYLVKKSTVCSLQSAVCKCKTPISKAGADVVRAITSLTVQTANSVADSSHITAPCARKRIIAMNLPTFKLLSTASF